MLQSEAWSVLGPEVWRPTSQSAPPPPPLQDARWQPGTIETVRDDGMYVVRLEGTGNTPISRASMKCYTGNLGAYIVTNIIFGVPCYEYSRIYPKTLL